ncbi:MAG TPA: permease-like cell division protein FtsX [Candidatus Binatia bacterium]|nr:permease-like cell division protein FtsX [Candidatus Binatia bacterium]
MRRLRPFYFVRRALANLRGAPRPAAVTASTIAIAIFLFGAFLLFGETLYRTLIGWAGEGDPVVVYARRGLPPAATEALARRIEKQPEVARVRVIPPAEGLQDLRRTLGDDANVLEGIDADVLPLVLSVGLRGATLDPTSTQLLVARIRQFEGVEAVDSQVAWVERFATLGRWLTWAGVGWALILGFGALLVIGNSARLAALTRKEEIEVLRLVGASETFIIAPFFIEGAVQGLAGSLLGTGALAAAFFGLERSLADGSFLSSFTPPLVFLEPPSIAALLVAGPLLGSIGSASAARRYLRGVEL